MRLRIVRTLLAVAVLAGSFVFVRWWDFVLTPPVGHAKYQAVFLVNGQIFFGRFYDRLGPYAKIDDAYYIQQQPAAEQGQQGETKLVRRGAELHGPSPEMLVPKSAILFTEDLRADSQVAQFIDKDVGK